MVAIGTVEQIAKSPKSVTGQFLTGAENRYSNVAPRRSADHCDRPASPGSAGGPETKTKQRRASQNPPHPKGTRPGAKLRIIGARHNNLKNVTVEIPLGALVCVTGVSGSGKSSLVNDILAEALNRDLNAGLGEPGRTRAHRGA